MVMGCGNKQLSSDQAKQFIMDYQKIKYELDPKTFATLDTGEKRLAYLDDVDKKVAPQLTEKEQARFIADRKAQFAPLAAEAHYKINVKDVVIEKIEMDETNKNKVTIEYKITLAFVPYNDKELKEETHNAKMELIKDGDVIKINRDWEDLKDSLLLKFGVE